MAHTPGYRGGFNPFRDSRGRWATKSTSALDVGAVRRTPAGDNVVIASGAAYHTGHLQPLQANEVIAATYRGVRIALRPPVDAHHPGNEPVAVAFTADGHVAGIARVPKAIANPRALAKAIAKATTEVASANAAADARRTPGARQMMTDDDVRSFLAEHRAWTARQTPAQVDAIHRYQKDSDLVNAALRSDPASLAGEGARVHEDLTAQLTPAKAAFRTYRGTNTAYLGGELDVGATFTERGWLSTSLSDTFVGDFAKRSTGTFAASKGERGKVVPGVMEITVAKGQTYVPAMRANAGVERIPLTRTVAIKADSPDQPFMKFGEVILPPGTTYRVTGKRYEQQGRTKLPVYTVEIVSS
ncbi:MAG: ADP-ribosyltransferase [Chloroflexales bacterium]